jgi:POT family proton-dependent oligopeptide transporter
VAWYIHDKIKFDQFLVTAPPTGNVITSVFEALRRRRVAKHRASITLVQGRSSTQQDDVAFSNEDETLLRETKAALKACLLL